MKMLLKRIRLFFEVVPDAVRRHRKLMWIAFVLITLGMIAGLPRVIVNSSMLSFFEKDEPIRQAYDRFRAQFGGDEVLYIVYEAKDGDVFSERSLKAVKGIQEELLNYRLTLKEGNVSPLDHITDVTTLVNASYLEAKEGALISRDFIGENIPTNESHRNKLKRLGINEPNYLKIFFSEDYRFGGMVIETDFNAIPIDMADRQASGQSDVLDDDDAVSLDEDMEFSNNSASANLGEPLPKFKENVMQDYVPFMDSVLEIVQKPEYSDHLTFYPVGTPPFMHFATKMILEEMGMIALGTLVLISIVALILFRALSAIVWLLGIVITSLIWLMGTVGWSGIVMPDLIIIIVFFILAVGVADAIHILSGYMFYRRQNMSHPEALRCVFRKSGLACFLTSVTTSIGFFSMILVPIVSMQKIGLFAGLGVLYAFFVTIFFLPLMLDIWSPVSKKAFTSAKLSASQLKLPILQVLLRKIETIGIQYSGRVIVLFTVISVFFAFGIPKIKVESSNIEIIRKGTPIRIAFNMADRFMGGTDNLEILVDTGKADGLKDPQVLALMDSLQHRIETRFSDTITNTTSLVDVTKNSYKALNDGDPTYFVIPKDPRVLAQTLFLFNNANQKDRRQLVSDDYRIARITVRAKSLNTINTIELMNAVDHFAATLIDQYPDLKITTTGQIPLRMKMFDYISWSQLISFGVTLSVISLFLLVTLGSFKLGFIAIIPNLFPVVTVAGLMGYLGIPLDVHTVLVIPIVIGISVDDTIHFLTHFRLEMETHSNTRMAIIHTFREVGQAIVFTSLVLSIGFFMFLASKNQGFFYFGTLNAIAVSVAVIADLILLPAVLRSVYKPSTVHQVDKQELLAVQEEV